MDIKDLVVLCKAGYTKDEIFVLTRNNLPESLPENPPVKEENPRDLIAEAPKNNPVEEPSVSNSTILEDLKKEVESLKQQLFNKNIATIQQPEVTTQLTADDITGLLLNSEEMQKGGK